MTSPSPIRTVLVSVSDKTGIVAFCRHLLGKHHVRILSTGGTASLLKTEGLTVQDVSDYTGFPEMMDGRVKTLHPSVHGGILARRDHTGDTDAMQTHNITAIDMVVVNLYPFEATVARGADTADIIENIDIGGPAMIRAAAKNHADVAIVTSHEDYSQIMSEMDAHKGALTQDTRTHLAAKAYAHTAHYDAAISKWFATHTQDPFPATLSLPMQRSQSLRYGENPHQQAAFYGSDAQQGTLADAQQLHGKELSFNNINDTDAAWKLVCEFDQPAIAIIKHANPCGVAVADTLDSAYKRAFACDPQSAYGGIIAANQPFDEATATALSAQFAEVVIAPSYSPEALALLSKKKNLRILCTNNALLPSSSMPDIRSISGGYLVQDQDACVFSQEPATISKRQPASQEVQDMKLAFTIAKHVKSNAIVLAKDGAAIGIGAGQMSRVDSVRIACQKAQTAGLDTNGCAMASDAFFPFDDNIHQAAKAGVTAIIQPGGSIRDDEVVAAADSYDMALMTTGIRHFRH